MDHMWTGTARQNAVEGSECFQVQQKVLECELFSWKACIYFLLNKELLNKIKNVNDRKKIAFIIPKGCEKLMDFGFAEGDGNFIVTNRVQKCLLKLLFYIISWLRMVPFPRKSIGTQSNVLQTAEKREI